MTCPRPNEECYEFMCGSSINGICKQGVKEKLTTDERKLIDDYNVQIFKQNGILSNRFQCSWCGRSVTADDSISNRGHNLICIKCVEDDFGNVKRAMHLYVHNEAHWL